MDREMYPEFDGEDMRIERVADDGRVVIRFFGGSRVEVTIPSQLVPYYRRLVREPEELGR